MLDMMKPVSNTEVLCFGELLWDLLPAGALPGGAPMNVAYHLHKLGRKVDLISRVGDDARGTELRNVLRGYGLNTNHIQLDNELPTGLVYAKPNAQHEMEYDIVKPVAWDGIAIHEELLRLAEDAPYFVFGSLATRSLATKNSLYTLLELANKKVLDINLRPPHFDKQGVSDMLSKADVLKLNQSELQLISSWFGHYTTHREQVQCIQDQFHIPVVLVTLGAEGALFNYYGNSFEHKGFSVEVADTIGSGDAFLAALLSQFIQQASPEEALAFACATGALIASKNGGCPAYELHEISRLMNNNENSPFSKTKI
jgi:fructokinase